MNSLTPADYLKIVEVLHYSLGLLAVPCYCVSFLIIVYPLFGILAWDINGGFYTYFLILIIFAIFLSISISILLSARYVNRRVNFTFSLIVACLECFLFPFGLIVGITTLIILSDPLIKQLYNLD